MFHYVSKFVSLLLQPLHWIALLLMVGAILLFVRSQRLRNFGRALCCAAALLLLLAGWYPLPEALIGALEDRYAPPTADLSRFTGMVVLGGVFSRYDGRDRLQPALGCAGDRVVVPIPLMNQNRDIRLLFSGGASYPASASDAEAIQARRYFEHMGTDMSRVLFESKSRDTYENATFSLKVPTVDAGKPWLLITSASHMPRALATFRKAGWNVTPYPVNYYSQYETQWFSYSLFRGIDAWQLAIREYFGLAVYRLTGRL
jgi:uncharacterized SAM-binding protein YcdF (DUF218 family)